MTGLALLLAALWGFAELSHDEHGRRCGWLAVVLVLCAATAPFVLFLGNLPVADDFFFKEEALKVPNLFRSWGHPILPGLDGYRPVTLLSYWLDGSGGAQPAIFRSSNVAMHAAVCVLLLGVLMKGRISPVVAGAAVTLFAVAPIHHENVLWISGRPYLLGTFFTLGAVFWWIGDRRVPSILATIVAAGCHESFVVVPAILATLVLPRRKAVGVFVLSLAVSLPIFCAVLGVGHELEIARTLRNVVGMAARITGLPRGRDLSPEPLDSVWLCSAVSILVIVLFGRAGWNNSFRYAGAAIVSVVPFLFLPGYADRFGYLPSLFVLCAGMPLLAEAWSRHRMATAACWSVVVLGALSQMINLSMQWRDAGQTAQAVIESATQVLQTIPADTPIRFEGTPLMHGSAYVFMSHFDAALESKSGQSRDRWSNPPASAVTARWDPLTKIFVTEQ